MKEFTNFTIDDTIFNNEYKAKNIAFFNLIDSGKYEKAYYVYASENKNNIDNDTISIITPKSKKPMSLPVKLFLRALYKNAYNDILINRDNINNYTSLVFDKDLEVIDKTEFFKKMNEEIALNQTKNFWGRIEKMEQIKKIIEMLQLGQEIVISVTKDYKGELIENQVLFIRDDLFILKELNCKNIRTKECKCENHFKYNESILIPKDALNLISNYLIKTTDSFHTMDVDYLIDSYTK